MPSQSHPIDYRRASKPFELIHVDLKSFPVPSYHKYQHEILLYDDYSSYTWSISLRTKDNALQSTRQWFSYVETQYGAKVIKWKSDSGGELKSHAFTNMLKDKGIEIIPSAPHIHQQNGRAERIIRTLMDKSEAMRHDACIPQSWWEFSFEHAAHLHNRTPTRRLEWRTPYELLNGTKPDISHLRVFGCGAYVFLPPEVRKNKLSPKSELMIYLGVGAGNHNHKFMRLPNNVIFTAAQALFDESLFPKCSHEKKRQGQQSVPEPVEPVDQATTPSLLPDDGDEPCRPPSKPSTKGKGKARDVAPAPALAVPPVPPQPRAQHREDIPEVQHPMPPQPPPVDRPGTEEP
ncbi:hypothetical protein GSI_09132 [Ganoderma sinense ZZ0214-1]|uniref:Integrase catalytic domain-containing protein n=1 Tax=Ganoderma sinense ZZ0214-1 TaxID=1077348 RepID=A0A2G8S5S0_9APHY|nr:hypothetical protein GSI_09132 [Ganoderma sinense ZZ0214-1]